MQTFREIETAERIVRPTRRPPIKRAIGEISAPHVLPLPTVQPQLRGIQYGISTDADAFSPHKILTHFDRLQQIARGELAYPVTVEIDPCNTCNHRCRACCSLNALNGQLISLPRIAQLASELRACDVRSVVLTGGGEPSAHPRFTDILQVLYDANLPIGLITNGSFPRPLSIEAVLRCCQWVRISLDAATARTHQAIHGTGDFDRIIQNVRALVAGSNDATIGLNFAAEQLNCREIAAFAKLGRSLGVAYISFRPVLDAVRPLDDATRQVIREQAELAKQSQAPEFRVYLHDLAERSSVAAIDSGSSHARCLGPNLIGIVGGDEHVYACSFLRGNRAFSFGGLAEQSFEEIWSGQRRREVMQSIYDGACNRVCDGGTTRNRYDRYNEILNHLAAETKAHVDFA